MEAYVDAQGKMKPEFLKEPAWNVFVKVLLTQLDCLFYVLSWCIAIYLAICRATFFFFVDMFLTEELEKPGSSIGRSPSSGDEPKTDADTPEEVPSRDDKKSADKRPTSLDKLKKGDSGLSSLDSGSNSSGSPMHVGEGNVSATRTPPSDEESSGRSTAEDTKDSLVSENVEVQK